MVLQREMGRKRDINRCKDTKIGRDQHLTRLGVTRGEMA